jgi:hypothetical protein
MFNEKPTYVNTREFEEKLLTWLKKAEVQDPRWQAIARTHFEEGFMAFRRALHGKYHYEKMKDQE